MMGRVATELADAAWFTADNPRSEDPQKIIDEMRSGVTQGVAWECVDRRQAIGRALYAAESTDTVLIAGKGHERYQEVNGAKLPFDDAAVAVELLSEVA